MIRTILAASALVLAFTAEAAAQDWSHEGIALPQREDWCTKTTQQDDGSGGKIAAFEARPCGEEMPYMSVGVAVRGAQTLDMEMIASQAADTASGDQGKAIVDAIIAKRDEECTRTAYTVALGLVEGVSGYDVKSRYVCATIGETTMRTFTAYAQRANGDVWVVAFDHPLSEITPKDATMLRGAIAAIKAS